MTKGELLVYEQGEFRPFRSLPPFPYARFLQPQNFFMERAGTLTVVMELRTAVFLPLSFASLIPGLVSLVLMFRFNRVLRGKAKTATELSREMKDDVLALPKTASGFVFSDSPRLKEGLLAGIILVVLSFLFECLAKRVSGPALQTILLLALAGAVFLGLFRLLYWIAAPYRKGDLGASLKRAELLKRLHFPFSGSIKVGLLVDGGRFDEARTLAEEHLAREEKPSFETAVYSGYLGWALTALGEYDKAEKCLSTALTLGPPEPSFFTGLALKHLLQAKEPEKALDCLETAFKIRRRPLYRLHMLLSGIDDSFSLHAALAWALAQLGRSTEAETALKEGFDSARKDNLPEYALFCYFAGQARLVLGSENEARHFLRQAMEICRESAASRLAADALRR